MKTRPCETCHGDGTLICGSCNGCGCSASGPRPDDFGPHINCYSCGGGGAVGCHSCDGQGEVPDDEWDEEDDERQLLERLDGERDGGQL